MSPTVSLNTFMILYYDLGLDAQGQFPCPLHSLGEAMPQYWFGILDVPVPSSHSSSVDQATTPFLLTTLVAIVCLTGMF